MHRETSPERRRRRFEIPIDKDQAPTSITAESPDLDLRYPLLFLLSMVKASSKFLPSCRALALFLDHAVYTARHHSRPSVHQARRARDVKLILGQAAGGVQVEASRSDDLSRLGKRHHGTNTGDLHHGRSRPPASMVYVTTCYRLDIREIMRTESAAPCLPGGHRSPSRHIR